MQIRVLSKFPADYFDTGGFNICGNDKFSIKKMLDKVTVARPYFENPLTKIGAYFLKQPGIQSVEHESAAANFFQCIHHSLYILSMLLLPINRNLENSDIRCLEHFVEHEAPGRIKEIWCALFDVIYNVIDTIVSEKRCSLRLGGLWSKEACYLCALVIIVHCRRPVREYGTLSRQCWYKLPDSLGT